MGGLGSTRWNGRYTRETIEACYSIMPPRGDAHGRARYAWTSGFSVTALVGETVKLLFTFDGKLRQQNICLSSTAPRFGGRRWWFICPGCARRVAHLHLPHKRESLSIFLCRHCYDLSYESAQYHGSLTEWLFKRNAESMGVSHRAARQFTREHIGGYVHQPQRPVMLEGNY